MNIERLPPMPQLRKLWLGEGRDLDDAAKDDFNHVDDLAYRRRPRKIDAESLLHVRRSVDHIQRLPDDGENIHLVLGGSYNLWSMIPAIIELAGEPIAELQSLTLSFSRHNIEALCKLIDAGQIVKTDTVVSHYFAHSNAEIYDPALAALSALGQRLIAVRNHAKVFNIRMASDRTFTVESSANWRSCKNIETAVLISDRGLFDFHHGWIDSLFRKAVK